MEKWYIIVADEKRNAVLLPDIVNIHLPFIELQAQFGKKTYEKTFQFRAEAPGESTFKLFVRPNGYLGLDYETEIKYTVLPKGEKKKVKLD